MILLLGLVLTAPVAFACGGFFGCFKAELAQAFAKIAASDSFVLVPGLTFERRQDVPRSLDGFPVSKKDDVRVVDVYRSAERLFKSHALFWNVLPGVDISVSEGKNGNFVLGVERCHHESESRTFRLGMMRRMKLIMLPIMYKLGVITTLLTLLTVFALKGLTIGVLLLVMSSAGLAAKFKYAHHSPHWSAPGKEVHVHVHGQHSYHTPSIHYDDLWVREDRPQEAAPTHQQWIHHQPPPPIRSTASPWASYIGDQSI